MGKQIDGQSERKTTTELQINTKTDPKLIIEFLLS